MSSAVALASVTRLLKDMLSDVVDTADVTGKLGSDVKVSALPPDKVATLLGEGQPSRLNLFLHRITPNTALSNSDLPTRDARGRLVAKPRLAVDLHYLLTAYGNEELQGEILLGYSMMVFHELALLPRSEVKAALKGTPGAGVPVFGTDDPAKLADQIELIKITPEQLSLEDMSKVWTSLQTNYRTTIGYMVSVVIMEPETAVRTPLPVLSRGPVNPQSGRDAGVAVHPDLTPSAPVIARAIPAGDRPAMRLGDVVTFMGFHLDTPDARVCFTEIGSGTVLELSPLSPPTPRKLEVRLPQAALPANSQLAGRGEDPDAWRIGAYLVEIVLSSPSGTEQRTNRVALSLAPRAVPVAAATAVNGQTEITVGCAPQIRKGQSVVIVAGQSQLILPPPVADLTPSVHGVFDGLPAGATIPIRLTVAGIDSLLIDPTAQPPRFDPSQVVVVP